LISLDTNLVVRVLTADDPKQTQRAQALLERETVWVSKTVLLETEWVLRFSYELSPEKINAALTAFLGLPQVHAETPDTLALALAWHAGGLDFADALHLASSEGASEFVTFDRALIKKTSRIDHMLPVREP
jgi:predicted nucleic-acid-binding protein